MLGRVSNQHAGCLVTFQLWAQNSALMLLQVYEGSDDEDADLERQRAWDDWKDEHPTGYGNSKLRPTA